jgi:hypothetical protein
MSGTITIKYSGLIATFVSPTRDQCILGILSHHPPGHTVDFEIETLRATGSALTPVTLTGPLDLTTTNTTQTGITLIDSGSPIDRRDKTQRLNSFNWIVDLDNPHEFYPSPLGADKSGFAYLFTLNTGDISTVDISSDVLWAQRGMYADYEQIGYVAVSLKIVIRLDKPESSAILLHGGQPILTSEPDTSYNIKIVHDAPTHPPIVTDANYYYTAVGAGIREVDRIRFLSTSTYGSIVTATKKFEGTPLGEEFRSLLTKIYVDSPPTGPEAACFPPFLGGSYPPH